MTRFLIALGAFAIVSGLSGLSGPALAQQGATTPAAEDNPIVARVDGQEIRQSDVTTAYSRLPLFPACPTFQDLLCESRS